MCAWKPRCSGWRLLRRSRGDGSDRAGTLGVRQVACERRWPDQVGRVWMYEADLAQHIKEHFGEIVEGLDAADVEDAESDFEEE